MNDIATVLSIGAFIIILVTVIVIYNHCKALSIKLDERKVQIQTGQSKLNTVYREVAQLLNKYQIHETGLMTAIANGQKSMSFLATNYPQLKADSLYQSGSSNFDTLYSQLQEHIAEYNKLISTYNIYVTQIPRVVVCAPLGFSARRHAEIRN